MNRSLSSTSVKKSLQQDLAGAALPVDTLPVRWGSRMFYVLSALIHIAAVVALSSSWVLGTAARKASASTDVPNPPKPTIARMSIDVGPIKFCEMNIDKVVGPPRDPAGR